MRAALFAALAALAALSAAAAPQLKPQAEPVAGGEFKAKVLAASEGVPPPTPQFRKYRITSGGETREARFYVPADLWRARAFAGEWKDRRGNVMRLARVLSLVPAFEREDWYQDEIERRLDELEKSFGGSEAELAEWRKAWGGAGRGRFVQAKGGRRYWVEFEFKDAVKDAEAEKLLKAFERSMTTVAAAGARTSGMKWWTEENDEYRFLTDLDRAKGGKFVKDAMRLLGAMRKSYEFYVPPQRKVGKCVVRVFRTLAGYREYRASTGDEDKTSCGLWDPSRDELLVVAEDPAAAQSTMRHEGFHQYLHYATACGEHAMWFNEGHATFFENVRYLTASDTVKVVDSGNRATWVSKNPELYANHIRAVVGMDRSRFYSGDLNLNYCTAWALTYFLEKGAWADECFAPYRAVLPKYLELMKGGADAAEATREAWASVAGRDVAADFLKFWRERRKRALNAR